MALIGNLVKRGIALSQKISSSNTNEIPIHEQKEQLKELLHAAKDTSFGRYYGFSSWMDATDVIGHFQSNVPIHTYDKMHREWWGQQQKYPDITWPGIPSYFALSSGTTGKSSKRIPMTDAFLQSMRDVGSSFIRSLPNFELPDELFESEVLMLSSSANLTRNENNQFEGEISGINVNNFPGWYDLFYRPGKEIARIDDWDERVLEIAKAAPEWNIGAIAGIPSWVLLMLQKIIEYHDLNSIHEIWPNLTVFASGGVAYETYRSDFDKLTEKPLVILDTYLASEGFFAYTARPDVMDMRLALRHGYFYEFIPFDERGVDEYGEILENPEVLTIDEVECGQDYVLLVSTSAGTWRYVIGDTIRFTALQPPEMVLTGRTKFFLNVVGSQLSEEKLDTAILELSEAMEVTINEYSVSVLQDENDAYYHQWVLVTDDAHLNAGKCKDQLDSLLKAANNNYKVARSKALKHIEVEVINKAAYYDFLSREKKKGGQVKTPKVMRSEEMKKLLKGLKKH
ncbi:MAG: GH3 family domain-containing protein [Bacteroidota bacterium]